MCYVFQHQLSLQLSPCRFHHRLCQFMLVNIISKTQCCLCFYSMQSQYSEDMIQEDLTLNSMYEARIESHCWSISLNAMQYRRSKADSFSTYTTKKTPTHLSESVSKFQIQHHVCKKCFQLNKMKAALCKRLPERNFRKVTPTIVRGFTVNVLKGVLLVNPLIISSTVHIFRVTDNEKSMHARGFSSKGLPSPMAWDVNSNYHNHGR